MTRHAEIIRLSARLLDCVGEPAQPIGAPPPAAAAEGSTPRIAEAMGDRTMSAFMPAARARRDVVPHPAT
jgi:hypothetical protein